MNKLQHIPSKHTNMDMENTFFESPEYPALERLKKCLILFVRRSIGLLIVLLLIRIAEISLNYHFLQPKESLIVLMAKGILYTLIYFLKSLPFLFFIYAVFFFTPIGKRKLKVCNYVLFAIYLLIELLLSKYFFSTGLLLGDEIITEKSRSLNNLFSLNIYWIFATIISLIVLWLALHYSRFISFINHIYALIIISIGIIFLFLGVPALPANNGSTEFKVEISKSAYFFNETYAYFFDKEPDVDIYKQNYFD